MAGAVSRWVRTRVRNTARIARWEVTKNAGGVDRRAVAIALLAVLGLGTLGPLAVTQGVALDQGIYRVGVTEEDPLYPPTYFDPTFRVQEPSPAAVARDEQEVIVDGALVGDYADTTKGRAAVSELRSTVTSYNDQLMIEEDNESAAFPVVVNLTYAEQDAVQVIAPQGGSMTLGSDEGSDGSSDGGESGGGGDGGSDWSDGPTDGGDGSDGPTDGGDGSDGAGGDGTSGDESSSDGTNQGSGDGSGDAGGTDDGTLQQPGGPGGGENVGGSSFTARLTGGSVSGTPSAISPPFPFRSLVLAFVFVLPLNFIIQAYGSTMLSERINRRGELLLVAPVSRGDIIVGKTLPYFGTAIGVATLITLALRGSHVSVLAVVPLAMLFLSATFLGAMFARSFKELTFVTVTITVSLTTYAFVPAIFTDVTPIALISPLTLVVRDLQDQAITVGQFVFSTLPPTLTALVLFSLGAGLYREEDMFTQRPIPLKVLDAFAGRIKRKRSVALVTAVLLPFVLVAELVVVAMLFALGEASIPFILVAVAVIEEIAKSIHVYAGYAHAKFDDRLRTALIVGALSGLGFFVAEKFVLIAQLVGLDDLPAGRAQLGAQATLNTNLPLPVVAAALLVAPLILHVVTATISALGARRGRRSYLTALSIAVVVHLTYNLTVVATYV